MTDLAEMPGLPEPQILFTTPGEAHSAMLAHVSTVFDELRVDGLVLTVGAQQLIVDRAWAVWRHYAPVA